MRWLLLLVAAAYAERPRIVICILESSEWHVTRMARIANIAFYPPGAQVQLHVVSTRKVDLDFWRHGRYWVAEDMRQVPLDAPCIIIIEDYVDASPFLFFWFWRMRHRSSPRAAIAANENATVFSPNEHQWRGFLTMHQGARQNLTRPMMFLYPRVIDRNILCRDYVRDLTKRHGPPFVARTWNEQFLLSVSIGIVY